MINETGATISFLAILKGFKGTIQEVSAALTDNIRAYRVQNQIKILEKTKLLCSEKNIQPNVVPNRILAPLLQEASFEDNEELQSRWAALLANSIDDPNIIHPCYINILKQLTSAEAKLIDTIYDDIILYEKDGIGREDIKNLVEINDAKSIEIIINNLIRLGLLEFHLYKNPNQTGKGIDILAGNVNQFVLTELGRGFVRVCK